MRLKKRPEPPSDLRPPPSAEPEALPTKGDFAPKTKDKGIPEEEKADDNDPVVSIERPEPDETEPENNSREEESDHLSGDYDTPSTEPPKQVRQIKDSKMIEKRISECRMESGRSWRRSSRGISWRLKKLTIPD